MSSGARVFNAASIALTGKNLIEASAGTGKTYAITTLFVRLLLEKHLNPADILVVTFTEAATLELRERVRARLLEARVAYEAAVAGKMTRDEGLRGILESRRQHWASDMQHLERALQSIDEAPISTLHGFCQRVLGDNAFRTRMPFDAEITADLSELQDDLLYDFWQRKVSNGPEGLARQLDALGIGVQQLRMLLREGLRNPRTTVVPPAPTDSVAAQMRELLGQIAERSPELNSAFEFIQKYCSKTAFGGGSEMEGYLAQAKARLQETDPAKFCLPRRPERFFRAYIEESLLQKFKSQKVPEFFALYEQLVPLCAQQVLQLQHELLDAARWELPQRKLAARVIGFDDLLLKVADALTSPGGEELAAALRRRFRAVLIDEVQDTDPVQFEIFEAAFDDGAHPLFLIGDPKQAIYGFRGGDVFAYVAAAQGARHFNLGTSYRADPGVLAAINALFNPAGRFLVPGIGYADVQAKPKERNRFQAPYLPPGSRSASLEVLFLERSDPTATKLVNKGPASRTVARAVAADIVRLLDQGATLDVADVDEPARLRNVGPGDIAVLTRTNDQCFLVQDALHERGVHAVVIGDKSVFLSEEAAEMQALLAAVIEPKSNSDLRRALATSMVGTTGDDFANNADNVAFWQGWVTRFQRWHELWLTRGFMRMFQSFAQGSALSQNLLRQVGGERRLTNVLHLAELLHRASREEQLGPTALLAWLTEQRTMSRVTAEQAEIRLESDEAAVKIMTAHLAKGLEFPIVYCPFLWALRGGGFAKRRELYRFHDARQDWRATLDIEVNETLRTRSEAAADWEGFAEEIRVAYVALTRAKHRTTVVWGGLSGATKSPAAFLLHGLESPAVGEQPVLSALNGRTDAELCADLERYIVRAGGAAAVRRESWTYDATRGESPAASRSEPLRALAVERAMATWRHTSSFSRLVKQEHGALTVFDEEESRDHDQIPLTSAIGGTGAIQLAEPPIPITLSDFPRGARTGNLFHEILEEIDFAAGDQQLESITAAKLRSYGIAGSSDELERWRAQAVTSLRESLAMPLLPEKFALRDVKSANKLAELEFRMPVGSKDFSLTRQRLANVFRVHTSKAIPDSYPRHIEQLAFRDLSGFLVGFVDLVFEHEGRWYVVDYKTNHLGDTIADYDTRAMTRALVESHYYLQYHIYTVALHRYLKHFLKGYDYGQHFGGVFYLFIKGMHPKAPPGSGVFFEKPPLARIEALSALLAGTETESRISA